MDGYYGRVKGWFLSKYPNYKDVDFAEVAASKSAANQAATTQPIVNRESAEDTLRKIA